jgi:hypothetical protein
MSATHSAVKVVCTIVVAHRICTSTYTHVCLAHDIPMGISTIVAINVLTWKLRLDHIRAW